jgi:hypothetical protein
MPFMVSEACTRQFDYANTENGEVEILNKSMKTIEIGVMRLLWTFLQEVNHEELRCVSYHVVGVGLPAYGWGVGAASTTA